MTRCAVFGLGWIGREIWKCAQERGHRMVAAIDVNDELVGRDAGELVGSRMSGIEVSRSLQDALGESDIDVVFHATGSNLHEISEQLLECVQIGANVVSTCEQLAYPWRHFESLAAALDRQAKDRSVRLVGGGVNPGYAMDALALVASAPCRKVDGVRVSRVVDLATRRDALSKKVGIGLAEAEFRAQVEKGSLGHVGLEMSAWLIADYLGLDIEWERTTIEPIVADRQFDRDGVAIATGEVEGCRQGVALGRGDEAVVQLELEMSWRSSDPRDLILLDSDPPMQLVVPGAVHGDHGTAGLIVNLADRLAAAPPGLLTVGDLLLLRYASGQPRTTSVDQGGAENPSDPSL